MTDDTGKAPFCPSCPPHPASPPQPAGTPLSLAGQMGGRAGVRWAG